VLCIQLFCELFRYSRIMVVDALSGTGVRALRYLRQIPDVSVAIANDHDAGAALAICANAATNCVGCSPLDGYLANATACRGAGEKQLVVSQSDTHKLLAILRESPRQDIHVIDFDPFGSSMAFMESAVQTVIPGGLLCCSCYDTDALFGKNAAACTATYGCVPLSRRKTPYVRELAIRFVLFQAEQLARTHGRQVEALLCYATDFYVRTIFRVVTRDEEGTGDKPPQTSKMVNQCRGCDFFAVVEVGSNCGRCAHCGSELEQAGPFWDGPTSSKAFLTQALQNTREAPEGHFSTTRRMTGLLTKLLHEGGTPFFYCAASMCKTMHCQPTIPARALIHHIKSLGYAASCGHVKHNSIKTSVSVDVLWSIIEGWKRKHGDDSKPTLVFERLHKEQIASILNEPSPLLPPSENTTAEMSEISPNEEVNLVWARAEPMETRSSEVPLPAMIVTVNKPQASSCKGRQCCTCSAGVCQDFESIGAAVSMAMQALQDHTATPALAVAILVYPNPHHADGWYAENAKLRFLIGSVRPARGHIEIRGVLTDASSTAPGKNTFCCCICGQCKCNFSDGTKKTTLCGPGDLIVVEDVQPRKQQLKEYKKMTDSTSQSRVNRRNKRAAMRALSSQVPEERSTAQGVLPEPGAAVQAAPSTVEVSEAPAPEERAPGRSPTPALPETGTEQEETHEPHGAARHPQPRQTGTPGCAAGSMAVLINNLIVISHTTRSSAVVVASQAAVSIQNSVICSTHGNALRASGTNTHVTLHHAQLSTGQRTGSYCNQFFRLSKTASHLNDPAVPPLQHQARQQKKRSRQRTRQEEDLAAVELETIDPIDQPDAAAGAHACSGLSSHRPEPSQKLPKGSSGAYITGRAYLSIADSQVGSVGASGIEIRGGARASVAGCYIHNCAKSGIFVHQHGQLSACENEITGSGFAGVEVCQSADALMDHNYVHHGRKGGVLVLGGGLFAKDNHLRANRLAAVDVRCGGHAVLHANFIADGGGMGVFVHHDSVADMAGNTITRNKQQGVLVLNSEY
jgi:tRNA (guanine26-N2/guanine27-N2)-dimethyltransferase